MIVAGSSPTLARHLRWPGVAAGTALTVALLLWVGRVVPTRPLLAVGIALAVLALGLTAVEPVAIPLAALPAVFVNTRLTDVGLDVAFSDVALAAGFLPALFLAQRPFSKQLRTLLWLSAAYQTATLFTVVANPYHANWVEWFHAWLLVSGSLVVGWAVGRRGYARAGLTLLLLAAVLLAVVTIAQALPKFATGDLDPVYVTWPYPMHKNFVGPALAFAALVAYVRPDWMGWNRTRALSAFWICALGVLVTQSRQAFAMLGVGLFFVVVVGHRYHSRSKLIILAAAPALGLAALSVKDQYESGNKFNSVFQRLTWVHQSMQVWAHDRLLGVGLRWWYTDRFPERFQPPNAELELLTTAGVVGLIGFLVLMIGMLVVLWRTDLHITMVGLAVLVALLVEAQMDLFWVSRLSIPFVIIGLSLGAEARAVDQQHYRRVVAAATAEQLPPHPQDGKRQP